MSERTLLRRSALVSLVIVMLLALTGLGFALADDFAGRDTIWPGTTAGDVRLGGLSAKDARSVLHAELTVPMSAPLLVAYRGGSDKLDASAMLKVDADAMVRDAIAPRRASTLVQRLLTRLGHVQGGRDIPLRVTVNDAAVSRYVAALQSRLSTPALDASVTVQSAQLVVYPSRLGAALDAKAAAHAIREALLDGRKSVHVKLAVVRPAVTEDSIGKSIIVSLSQRRLSLYDGQDVEGTYRVAIGTPSYPTPQGRWRVVNKRYMPTWRNPGSAWAADMPKSIPPGPQNPLGTRALDLDASGIRIHGTSNSASVGTAASHGCMRMHRSEIEDLYERVPVGTRVFIVQ